MVYAINIEFYCNCYYYYTCIQNLVFYACYGVCDVTCTTAVGAVVMATVTALTSALFALFITETSVQSLNASHWISQHCAVTVSLFIPQITGNKFVCLLLPGPSRDGTIGEDTIRASLISAVSDKLRWRMKEEMDRAQAELDALKRTEEDLKKGHQKLEDMVSRLDQEVVRTFAIAL